MKFLAILAASAVLGAAGTAAANSYAEDRAEIINLQGRYLLAMDFNDPEAYAAVFAEDAVLDWAGGEVVGRDAIREFLSGGVYDPTRGAAEVEDWPAAYRHFITNQVIEVYGDTAKAVTYWFQAGNLQDRGAMEFGMFGHYEDELRREDGQWRFTRRAIYNEGIPNRFRTGFPNPDPAR